MKAPLLLGLSVTSKSQIFVQKWSGDVDIESWYEYNTHSSWLSTFNQCMQIKLIIITL